jgi:hypothetical protein
MNREQKYFGEVGLLQATKGVALIKPAELPKIAKSAKALAELADAHVYFVCRRPRGRMVKGGARKSDGIRFTLNIANKGGTLTKELLIPDKRLRPEASAIEPEDGGAYMVVTDSQKRAIIPMMPLEELLQFAGDQLPELANLDVVYIGQAFGDSGSRTAIDRLQSHSTFQQILSDIAHNSWWMEPVLLLFAYDDPQMITKMDGRGSPVITGDEDLAHSMSIRNEPLSEAQAISIAEASLIRYFQPHYNSHFKGNYPTSDLQHLRDAYRLDYNAIITEIDTEDLYLNTFSKHQARAVHHIAQFDLHDPKERFSFFELNPSERRGSAKSSEETGKM